MTARKSSLAGECWWLHPLAVIFCMHLPIILLAHLFSEETYEALWDTPKHLDGYTLILFPACLLAIALGYALGTIELKKSIRSIPTPGVGPDLLSIAKLRKLLLASYCLTLLGLAIWLLYAVRNGFTMQDLTSFLGLHAGASSHIKQDYFTTLPGITTLTQFGMSAAIMAFLSYRAQGRKSTLSALIVLLVLNALRALFLSERLALIEVTVPVVVLLVHFRNLQPASRRSKLLLALVPVLGAVSLFLLFTGMEAFRSWTFYSAKSDSILTFGAGRLSGYYVTAVNNSGLIVENMPSSPLPYFTQPWFWKMPVIKNFLAEMADANQTAYGSILQSFGNSEFNNTGGILPAVHDFGVAGGLLYCVALGIVLAKVYTSFRKGNLAGLLLYPLFYVGLLEVSRVPYLNDGRSFPSLVMLLFAAFSLRPERRKRVVRTNEPQPTFEQLAMSRGGYS